MKRKIVVALLSASLLLSSGVATLKTQAADQPGGSGQCMVSATVDSTYSISIPATLNLSKSGSNFTGTYTVSAYGNVSDAKKLTVSPGSLTMTNTDHMDTTVDASVEMATKEWAASTLRAASSSSPSELTGTVSVVLTEAGVYSGNLNFTYGLESVSP